ncbi:MAG: AAA family ATPase [Chthoniobacter sp.]
MSTVKPASPLPGWAEELVALYESNAASQFILHGNVHDRFLLPEKASAGLGSLADFFLRVLLPRFDVVLSYDLGNGLRVERGGETFGQWPAFKENPELPRQPRAAVEALTRYFRYTANLARLGKPRVQVGCYIKAANLLAPTTPGGVNYDLHSLALLIREWADDPLLAEHSLVTVLITENLNDLHPLLVNNPRAAKIKVPLPPSPEIAAAVEHALPRFPKALEQYTHEPANLAAQLTGATQNAIDSLFKLKEYRAEALLPADLVKLKKQLVEEECAGLIEFIDSRRTLDDLHGQEKLKTWLRQDIALWKQGDLRALPMGYLICGPVGTGKTYLVECLAGEAGVPVVKIKNFRDRWVGSTEGNLEKIFRLLQALTRCFVFIDEADQALGKRDSGANDSGLSGRIYSMMAAEMSRPENRGRIIWVLASSRPDLIEVDLKRPGRVDVKIPIFPTSTPAESGALLAALCQRQGLAFTAADRALLEPLMPLLLTPGAAEALAVKIYRLVKVAAKPRWKPCNNASTATKTPSPPKSWISKSAWQ